MADIFSIISLFMLGGCVWLLYSVYTGKISGEWLELFGRSMIILTVISNASFMISELTKDGTVVIGNTDRIVTMIVSFSMIVWLALPGVLRIKKNAESKKAMMDMLEPEGADDESKDKE